MSLLLFFCKSPHIFSRECKRMIIASVLGVNVRQDVLAPDGRVNIKKLKPIARLGYNDYAKIGGDIFSMIRPKIS